MTAEFVPLPPRRLNKHGRVVEAEEWTSAIERFSGYLFQEAEWDPAALVHVKQLIEMLERGRDIVIYHHNSRPKGHRIYSQRDLGAILGISHTAVHKAATRGETYVHGSPLSLTGKTKWRHIRATELAARGVEDLRLTTPRGASDSPTAPHGRGESSSPNTRP